MFRRHEKTDPLPGIGSAPGCGTVVVSLRILFSERRGTVLFMLGQCFPEIFQVVSSHILLPRYRLHVCPFIGKDNC